MNRIPEYVDRLLGDALVQGASDIHIDPYENGIVIRLRVDGMLHLHEEIPLSMHTELVSRIKVMARLRTDVHLTPHDGRFRTLVGKSSIDVRVSIVPTHFGENAVLRLLPTSDEVLTLETLGFSPEQQATVREAIKNPHGMILVTGPTGAGKTSTQYSLISQINPAHRSIVTLEDPVEYRLPGVRQIPIQPKHGLNFAQGLRAVLRQDPDVIMVGEIRDAETAQIAVHTALTGHLLVSTLHTNSAIDTLPRLIDIGIEPYLVASTLTLVINQRLVRKLCPICRGERCETCRKTGFRGRTVVAEVFSVDDRLRTYIMKRLSRQDILKYLHSVGMNTIREDAMEKVRAGLTTKEEVLRVLNDF